MSDMQTQSGGPGYEKRDVNINKLIAISIGISILIVVIIIGLHEIFTMTKEYIVHDQYLSPKSSMLVDLHAREDSTLNSYGIVDAESGLYRIPVDEAINLTVTEAQNR